MPIFYEFFAGGGMARLGLGPDWSCRFANDIAPMKAESYATNWGSSHLVVGDVRNVSPSMLQDHADLAWASFPCQDLSLAGMGRGLGDKDAPVNTRSGAFWPFWQLMRQLDKERRPPRLIVLENVFGSITSKQGADFQQLVEVVSSQGYFIGGLMIDASLFVPQSRPRLFLTCLHESLRLPEWAYAPEPSPHWHPEAMRRVVSRFSASIKARWRWWRLPLPPARTSRLEDIIESNPTDVAWHDARQTQRLLSLMEETHLRKVERAKRAGRLVAGGVYKRTRRGPDGASRQRAEVRFDGIAGCLRTPAGGSSRQTLLVVEGQRVRSRLISAREAARLMGLPESYQLPSKYNDAYKLLGDGVAVPVVQYLAHFLLAPLLASQAKPSNVAKVAA